MAQAFAVSPDDLELAREALAATAIWVKEDLNLMMRVALVPLAAIRAQGLDVRVARFGPSSNLSYAMFSGGGLAWAEAAMKRGEFAVPAAPPGTQPDLSGLSCRFEEIPVDARRDPLRAGGAGVRRRSAAFRKLIEDIVALVERSPDSGRPVPAGGPPLRWPPAGVEFEARAQRGGSLFRRRAVRARAHAVCLCGHAVWHQASAASCRKPMCSRWWRIPTSANMTTDCGWSSIARRNWSARWPQRLAEAASSSIARYGLHRQDAAMMTCFTPSALRSDHVHFIDGARGGYASAATALKAMPA